jgi:murein DD-endopeptidase
MTNAAHRDRLTLADVFGLRPLAPALGDARRAVVGDPWTPRNLWGPSSLRIFKPWIGLPTWLGRRPADRRVPIYNFVNRVPGPRGAGYSTKVTYCRDWRGGRHTYDGHLGTDFAVPVGTPVVAAAPGLVVRVANDYDRGGLKVCVDHGAGLFTTSNHLARALVRPGDRLARGQPLGLSGASGMEFVLFFPWVAPHLHFNVWSDGHVADPFALAGSSEVPLWRAGSHPTPADGDALGDGSFAPTDWDERAIADAIATCRPPWLRAKLGALGDRAQQAAEILVAALYRPTWFEEEPRLYPEAHARAPRLDLPFRHEDYVGIRYPGFP